MKNEWQIFFLKDVYLVLNLIGMKLQKNYSLKSMNTFRLDCKAKRFVQLDHLNDLRKLISAGELQNSEILILGGGSNILLTKDFEGLVLHPQFIGVEVLEEDDSLVKIRIGAGESWEDFVEYTVNKAWYGIENLALIPGLMGAAPMQNIGAYGVELKDVFDSLRAVDLESGELIEFTKENCEFGYRTSVFKTRLKGKYLIYDVCLVLRKEAKLNIQYKALKNQLEKNPECEINQKTVFNAVLDIRNSKLPDPDKIGNAGSFFKNPVVSEMQFVGLKIEFSDIVGYPQENGDVKLAAGWLIDQAGLKGFRKGNVGTHEKQALVLVNYGEASGQEIYNFSEQIQQTVKNIFGVNIEREVNVV